MVVEYDILAKCLPAKQRCDSSKNQERATSMPATQMQNQYIMATVFPILLNLEKPKKEGTFFPIHQY